MRIGQKDGYRNGYFSDETHGYFAVGKWNEPISKISLEINTEKHEVLIQRGSEGLKEAGYYRDSAAMFKYSTKTKAVDLAKGEFLIDGTSLYFNPTTLDGRHLGPQNSNSPWKGNRNTDTGLAETCLIQDINRHTVAIYKVDRFGWGNGTNNYLKLWGDIKWWEKQPSNGDYFYISASVFGS